MVTRIKITDTDDGQEFIIFSEGNREEVDSLLETLNYADHIIAKVVN